MTTQTTTQTMQGWQLEGHSAEAYERYLAPLFAPGAQALVGLAGVVEGSRVLDVACGTGIVARQASPRAGSTGKVVGLDLNEGMLTVARSLAPDVEWRQGNAAELPFGDGSFDVVLCEQGMQFFSDPARCVREMRRVLVPGGRAGAIVCRPIRYSPAYVVMADALARHVSAEAGTMMRSPFPQWDAAQMRAFFIDGGFEDVHLRIEVCPVRYPSIEEFLRQEAASSPLAGPISRMGEKARRALLADLNVALDDHTDDDGVVFPLEVYVVLAV